MKNLIIIIFKTLLLLVICFAGFSFFYKSRIQKNTQVHLENIQTSLNSINETRLRFFKSDAISRLKLESFESKENMMLFQTDEYFSIKMIENFYDDPHYRELNSKVENLNHAIRNYNTLVMSFPNAFLLKHQYKSFNQYNFRYSKNPQHPETKSKWTLYLDTGDKAYYHKAIENGQVY